jgi:hypothetical protein
MEVPQEDILKSFPGLAVEYCLLNDASFFFVTLSLAIRMTQIL